MALSELIRLPNDSNESKNNFREVQLIENVLWSLNKSPHQYIERFQYRDKIVELRGIPEDFKILMDEKLVAEMIYGIVYNINMELARELVN